MGFRIGYQTGRLIVLGVAVLVAALSIWRLEAARTGVGIGEVQMGTTPLTLYSTSDAPAPLVVVAHGFAGSRQIMSSYSLTLARAGYHVVAFDFEGHGRNPIPMTGDVTDVAGTTARLVDETKRVLRAGLSLPQVDGRAALLGHSMATDVIVRAAREVEAVEAVVAVSMFSEAVTPEEPARLLAITGAWEPQLRRFALDALRQVDPGAAEGETARDGAVVRRAIVAPHVEHVGVLFSETALTEALGWLDATFERAPGPPPVTTGPALLGLMFAIVAMFWPISGLLPRRRPIAILLTHRQYALAIGAPAVIAPIIAVQVDARILPVLVADYLFLHMALQGLLQLFLLWRMGVRPGLPSPLGTLFPLLWGLVVFGVALDRYGASFLPIPERLSVVALLAMGAVPFMLGDALLTLGTRAPPGWRLAARGAVLASLGLATALDFERLFFLVLILPVIVLFYLVYGPMGRWSGLRTGATGAGIALGLILAWSLGVSFPLFAAAP